MVFSTSALACQAQESVNAELATEQTDSTDIYGVSETLRVAIEQDPGAYQQVLVDSTLTASIRDSEQFRDLMHESAIRHRISTLTLVPDNEPGERILVEGQVIDPSGAPAAEAIVRLFATDAEGLYHPTISGEELPRIFGTVVTDSLGQFSIETVRPGSYPGTQNVRHIHVSVRSADGTMRLAAPGYVVFDDDPLLFEPYNAEPRGEAIRISMQEGERMPTGTLVLPLR